MNELLGTRFTIGCLTVCSNIDCHGVSPLFLINLITLSLGD